MPVCYLVAVASISSLDRDSNNMSLFNLVEELGLERLGSVPLEAHVYWQLTTDERPFESRVVVTGENGDRQEHPPMRIDGAGKERMRIRMRGIDVQFVGRLRLSAEWRPLGAPDWRPANASWPLTVRLTGNGDDSPRGD